MGSTRYIMSMGELTRKDNSLCFRKNGRNVYIPVENTKEIYCCSSMINSNMRCIEIHCFLNKSVATFSDKQ